MGSPPAEALCVATAADRRYAMPLAVMVRSLLHHLEPAHRLNLFVLDGGLGARARKRLLESWDTSRLAVEWITPDVRRLRVARVSGHIGVATYFRLLLGDALPASLGRVIYLDADVVVESTLAPLWTLGLDGRIVAAAQDWIVATVSAPNGLRRWRELGLGPDQKYFNAGVLLVDLERWRREEVARRALDFLAAERDGVRWWDQDALNVVLAGDWLELDPRWNLAIRSRAFPPPETVPCGRAEYEAAVAAPFICHFATHVKPWHSDCEHPRRSVFFRYLDETAWSGWRPRRPAPPLGGSGLRFRLGRFVSRLRPVEC
jgi:lipopolysaccharide biosynthesis glycosyltransferase